MLIVNGQNIKKYHGAQLVLEDVTFEIHQGERVGLVGRNGSGKSTLLRTIAGLEDISSGQIIIDGKEVSAVPPAKRGIAMVFQSYALYPHMTVFDNMSFGLRMAKAPKDEIDAKVNNAAAILQLTPLLGRKPAELSGGQRQRVAIGRAIVREPDVFLFDEPLSNLDAALRVSTRVEIAKLHRLLKATMIYVTHDQIEALTLADRIAIMKSGEIQQLADPNTIYNQPRNLFVAGFIGSPSMNFLHGEIVEQGGQLFFKTHDVLFSLVGYRAKEALTAGRKVVLGVRPEHVKVDEENGIAEFHEAVVDIEEPMGADNLLWLKHAGHVMSVRIGGTRRYAPGARVRLSFDMSVASLFDATSEERI